MAAPRILKITRCGQCPHGETFMDGRSIGLRCALVERPFERDRGSATYPNPMPEWCPLPKEQESK